MIQYPNRIEDHHTVLKLREIIDTINGMMPKVEANSAAVASTTVPSLSAIQQALQTGGTNPLNVNGLPGTLANSQIAVKIGTHAQRLTTAATAGALFWESDRTVLYVGIASGQAAIWVYSSGTMQNIFANRPTDLGTNDINFSLFVTTGTGGVTYDHGFIWNGSAWLWNGDRAGIFVDCAINPGAGFQLCDGSTTKYLSVGSDLSENSFTTVDETGGGIYHVSAGSYSGTITAAVKPTFSGTNVAITGAFAGTPGTTGNDGDAGVDVTSSGSTLVALNPHTHPFTPAGSVTITTPTGTNTYTPAGMISISGGDPIANLGVLRYFRR